MALNILKDFNFINSRQRHKGSLLHQNVQFVSEAEGSDDLVYVHHSVCEPVQVLAAVHAEYKASGMAFELCADIHHSIISFAN